MGNCRSSEAAPQQKGSVGATAVQTTPSNGGGNGKGQDDAAKTTTVDESCSNAALFRALLPMILPIARQVVSKQLVSDKMVLRNETLVEDIDVENESELPIGPIEFGVKQVRVVDYGTLAKDQMDMPEFAWPIPAERLKSMVEENMLLVLDLSKVHLKLVMAPQIELTVPVEGPMGIKADLEIGTGGSIKDAWMEFHVPKLRLWYVNEKPHRRAHVAFMARPYFIPNLNVNADRGNGDFLSMDFQEEDGFDDVVETVLCGFGPSSLTLKEPDDDNMSPSTKKLQTRNTKNTSSWVADALGRSLSKSMKTFAGMENNSPLDIDLEATIQQSIDSALGKPRPADQIEADIGVLQKELAQSKEETEIQKRMSQGSYEEEEKKEEEEQPGKSRSRELGEKTSDDVAPYTGMCCGIGA